MFTPEQYFEIAKRWVTTFGNSQLTDEGQAIVDEAKAAYLARHEYPLLWQRWADHDCLHWVFVQLVAKG